MCVDAFSDTINLVCVETPWVVQSSRTGMLTWGPTYADIYLSLDGSLVQGGVVPVVPGVGFCSVVQQQVDHLGMAERAGVMERDQAAIIPGVNVGAVLE